MRVRFSWVVGNGLNEWRKFADALQTRPYLSVFRAAGRSQVALPRRFSFLNVAHREVEFAQRVERFQVLRIGVPSTLQVTERGLCVLL